MQNRTTLIGMLALTGVGVFLLARATRGPGDAGVLEAGEAQDTLAGGMRVPLGRGSTPGSAADAARSEIVDVRVDAAESARITCLESGDRSALPGVRLYSGSTPVAGPSGTDGVLSIEKPGFGKRTLWAPGWTPKVVYAPSLPSEVLMVAADASLEVRLLNFSGEHRVLRTLLQARGAAVATEGDWSPVLTQAELDTVRAEGIAPGAYDLYVWITYQYANPQPYSRTQIELPAGELTRLEIDIEGTLDGKPAVERVSDDE